MGLNRSVSIKFRFAKGVIRGNEVVSFVYNCLTCLIFVVPLVWEAIGNLEVCERFVEQENFYYDVVYYPFLCDEVGNGDGTRLLFLDGTGGFAA